MIIIFIYFFIYLSSDISNELEQFLIDNKIINEPHGFTQYNMGKYKCATVDFDVIRQYNEEGFNNFEESLDNEIET